MLGQKLIPVSRLSEYRWFINKPGWHYFPFIVTFPSAEYHCPFGQYIYLIVLVGYRGTCVNNLPRVVEKSNSQELNLQLVDRKSDALTITPSQHTLLLAVSIVDDVMMQKSLSVLSAGHSVCLCRASSMHSVKFCCKTTSPFGIRNS